MNTEENFTEKNTPEEDIAENNSNATDAESEDLFVLRDELVTGRISEIAQTAESIPEYGDYFARQASFLLAVERVGAKCADGSIASRTLQECIADQKALYGREAADYSASYLNPDYCIARFGEKAGRILTFLAAELTSGIRYTFERQTELLLILKELFVEIFCCFAQEEGTDLQEAQQTIYWHYHDYSALFTEYQVAALVEPAHGLYYDILMEADLSDPTYLYRYGLPVGENELATSAYLNTLSEEDIQKMADTFTEGYRVGFITTGKDISKKKTVSLHYAVGFERMMRAAVRNFAKMGLRVTLAGEQASSVFGYGGKRGVYSVSVNRQFDYDHKEDRALYFDKRFVEQRLSMLDTAFHRHEEAALRHGGPAVQETFGEEPFTPAESARIRYSESQQPLNVYNMMQSMQIQNRYIPGEERSFTIIAWPLPAIGEQYRAIFAETVKVNTLDYKKYQKIQQCLIDVLDEAKQVHIQGKDGNRTDLTVSILQLADPASQTAFENCVADVNIPVGEVFTSPVLKGTNGLLHVEEVYLNGLLYKELAITFADGMITDYTCANFESEEKCREYIKDNVLMHHDTLPMGEFAIGTNTTAYRMGRKYQINDKLPILIAEKCGPHFAVGDTCYSHAEDTAVYNPDGKEIMPRDNEITLQRKTEPQKAYFNCHTDITIPYEKLAAITVIRPDGSTEDLIRDGLFVLAGTVELNVPLEETSREP